MGRADFEDVPASSYLHRGDVVKTSPVGEAAIALLPNALIQLHQATELEIGALSLAKDGNETGEAMRRRVAHSALRRGSLTVAHERLDVAAEPDFRIETPFGTLTTNYDCVFVIDVDDRRTRLTAVTGFMSFAPPGKNPAPVDASSVGEWSADSAVIAAAAADARAQQEISDTLETEQKLRQLRSQLRDVLPHAKR